MSRAGIFHCCAHTADDEERDDPAEPAAGASAATAIFLSQSTESDSVVHAAGTTTSEMVDYGVAGYYNRSSHFASSAGHRGPIGGDEEASWEYNADYVSDNPFPSSTEETEE